jgi:pyocin large subunit-like protein
MREMITGAAAIAVIAALAACDNGARATAAQTPTPNQTARAESARYETARSDTGGRLTSVGWAASKTRSADEAAQVQFEKNGAALGATSVDDYVAEAKAFVTKPPKGAQTLTRPNGDRLIYDPASNRFAVATAEGTPRTLFKPREGAAYWDQQKARGDQPYRGGQAKADKSAKGRDAES